MISRPVTRFVPRNATHDYFGPAALEAPFVALVRELAPQAPATTYDGEYLHCGDQRLLTQRPEDPRLIEQVKRYWVAARCAERGYHAAGMHVEEALWDRSIKVARREVRA